MIQNNGKVAWPASSTFLILTGGAPALDLPARIKLATALQPGERIQVEATLKTSTVIAANTCADLEASLRFEEQQRTQEQRLIQF